MLGSNNRKDFEGRRGRGSGGPIGMVVKGIATGIGLASESIHHHKEKKRAQKEQEQQQQQQPQQQQAQTSHPESSAEAGGSSSSNLYELPAEPVGAQQDEMRLSQQLDEAAWDLDDAQRDVDGGGQSILADTTTSPEEIPRLADEFLRNHPLPPSYYDSLAAAPPRHLELPVVITQRRPKARTRGFVRAYAPELENVGIDQDTFLDFLDKLNKAVEPSPWLQAINLASFAGQAVPEPFTILISMAAKMAADAASEVHSRTKTNSFLDRMNEEFFKPRGVIALLLTWKPSSSEALTTVDFNLGSAITKETSGSSRRGMTAKFKHSMQASSTTTHFEFPATAPLIFPTLDDLAAAEGEQAATKKASAIKRSGKFVENYMDKRAQAEWAGQNPDSQMANALPKPEFHSRYADPNHPASSGDIVALLTGGYISSGRSSLVNSVTSKRGALLGRGQDRRSDRGGLLNRQGLLGGGGRTGRFESGSGRAEAGVDAGSRQSSGGIGGLGPLSLVTGVKKLLQNDVLYLLIVNRPSEEEMAAAAARFQAV